MSDVVSLLVLVALLLGNAFFVGAEFALVSARVDQLEPRADAGSARARKTLAAMRNVSQMMAGAQLGITLCSLGLGAVGEPAVAHLIEAPMAALGVPEGLLHPIALVIALSIVTVLHMVLGEMVPKNITIAGPDRAAMALGPALATFCRVLRPVIWFFNTTANVFVRLFGVTPTDEVAASFDETEIRSMVTQSRREGLLGSEVSQLATGALTFEQHTVEDVLLPMEGVVTVPRSTTPRQLEAVVAEHGYSRYPVQGEDGALLGFVHVKDVLGIDAAGRDRPIPEDTVTPLVPLAPGSPLPEVLAEMRAQGAHLGGVVADRRTVGLVALEDVLELLIGDVRDAAAQHTRAVADRAARDGRTGYPAGAGAGGR
ncbi:CBS domain containing-hemolysin-like protein [Geodermatophilus bullaregiensis]|uniref:hemolysin family protein n=1 Tax=Geodermatophilus bullaregiensis TaxID=1564160 RepID=UPI001959F7E1|nr:hemolysin family protein [Geodermatophilus bullaregiensis]MBM7807093.1 CBS domain containing-hemolysin-like protein [Geodermatophilus bullaregiensis]